MSCILISGGSGFLGHNLILGLAREHRVIAGFHSTRLDLEHAVAVHLDVTQPAQLAEQFTRLKPDLVVHAAALSQPDECERHPGRAQGVIVDGSRNMAQASREFGFRLIHISTDLVFDGTKGNYTEEDQVRGISVYSRAKIEAERIVREIAPSAVILRIAVLYGPGNRNHPGFVDTVMARWRSGQPMTFYVDQYRTPTFAPQVAEVVQKLLLHPESVRGVSRGRERPAVALRFRPASRPSSRSARISCAGWQHVGRSRSRATGSRLFAGLHQDCRASWGQTSRVLRRPEKNVPRRLSVVPQPFRLTIDDFRI